MKTPHKHAELIKAWADGAEIEARERDTHEWGKCSQPAWFDFYEYRIKPEPKPDVSFYACLELDNLPKRVQVMHPDPCNHNVKLTFDGETGKLKAAEVLK